MTYLQKSALGAASLALAFTFAFAPTQASQAQAATTLSDETVAQLQATLQSLAAYLETQRDMSMEADPVAAQNSDAADLRVQLNALLREHVNLGLNALHSVTAEHEDVEATVAALDENSVELAETVGSVYGNDAEEQFLQLWRDHIGFFANYAVGVREGDQDMQDEAREDLEGYAEDTGAFFAGALNDESVAATIEAGANEHQELLTSSIDAYEAGDYAEAYQLQREADKQIQGLADLLAEGIVAQNF